MTSGITSLLHGQRVVVLAELSHGGPITAGIRTLWSDVMVSAERRASWCAADARRRDVGTRTQRFGSALDGRSICRGGLWWLGLLGLLLGLRELREFERLLDVVLECVHDDGGDIPSDILQLGRN